MIRKLLIIVSLCLICAAPATAWRQGIPSAIPSTWNGQLTQTNGSALEFQGEYALINKVTEISHSNDFFTHYSPNSPVPANCENAQGFPIYNCDGNPLNNGGWASGVFTMPSQTERPGNYYFDWIGGAGTQVDFTSIGGPIAAVSGAGCSQSGNKVTGPNCLVTITTPSGGTTRYFNLLNVDSTVPLTQMRFYHVDDAAAMATCQDGLNTVNFTEMGSCFTPQFLTEAANFGVWRDLNKSNAVTNNLAFWADRTPLTLVAYSGQYWNSITTNQPSFVSGDEYTLSAPLFCTGGVLANCDKQHIQLQPAAEIDPVTATASSSVSAASCQTTTCVVPLNSVPASLVVGMGVSDNNNGNAISLAGVTVGVIGGSSVTLNCVHICLISGQAGIASGDTLSFSAMLNVNGLGYVPVMDNIGSYTSAVLASGWSTLTYDAGMNVFLTATGSNSNAGLNGGWPPELTVALANKLGMHPWFVSPCYANTTTDWIPSLISMVKTNLAPGLIPIYEPPNEDWNDNFYCTKYGFAAQYMVAGGSGASNYDNDNWYGTFASAGLGQLLSALYGFSQSTPAATRSLKYRVVVAGQTNVTAPTKGGGGQDEKLSSTWYVSQGGTAAYNWVTDWAVTTYFGSSCNDTLNEVGLAYAYSISPSPTLIATYLNDPSPSVSPACGVNANVVNGTQTLYTLYHNIITPGWANYISSYVNAGYSIALTQYEGGMTQSNGGINEQTQSASISAISTGTTTTLTVGANAWNYMCNTANVCSSQAQVTVSGANITANCPGLIGTNYVTAATSTTVTLNYNSTAGCTTATGTAVYTGASGSSGWMQNFEYSILRDTTSTNTHACELANLQLFLAAGAAASPVPIVTRFPSEYDLSDGTAWGKIWPDIYSLPSPYINAVQDYQISQTGNTTCSP